MIQAEHLQVYDLILTTKAPVFMGSGICYTKKEYLYDKNQHLVKIINQDKFFGFLLKKNLIDDYEHFVLGKQSDLYEFLTKECHCLNEELDELVQYSVSAADAINEKNTLKEIQAFQRGADGQVYVPGSGVKGALSTAYLVHCILKGEIRKNFDNIAKNKKIQDIQKNIFRGVQLSDSIPIGDNAIILAGKYDSSTTGKIHQVNVCRECIRPEQTIRMKLTLDQSVLKGAVTKESLLESIQAFSKYYHKTYTSHFELPRLADETAIGHYLILGGGAGFFSKTLMYPYYGKSEGLEKTIALFKNKFKKHHHEADKELGISPRMMKYTKQKGKLIPFGLCEVKIQ